MIMGRILDHGIWQFRKLASKLSLRFFELDGKSGLIAFRTVVSILMALLALSHAGNASAGIETPFWTVIAVAGLQMLTNLLFLVPLKKSSRRKANAGIFVLDILLVSGVIYLTQGLESDLYLIYFLVVFMTVLARRPGLSFTVAGVACLLYGVLFLKSHEVRDLVDATIILRFSLLWVIALFSSVVVQDLESKDEMISQIGHELRTPLASIQAAVRLTMEEFRYNATDAPDSAQLKMLSIIDRSTTRIVAMVDDILGLFRLEMGKEILGSEPLRVDVMVNECVEDFAAICAEKELAVSGEVEPQLPMVMADGVKIRQALSNLIGNAMKFTPSGGKIIVGARRIREFHGWQESVFVELFVRDTGIGISAEQQGRIFDKFYQVRGSGHQSRPGLGLGLALVKAIIAAHQGTLSVKSAPGQGSTFIARLPAIVTAPDRDQQVDRAGLEHSSVKWLLANQWGKSVKLQK